MSPGGPFRLVVGAVAAVLTSPAEYLPGNYLGGSLGFALLGVLAAVVYHSRIGGKSDSLAGAVAASRHLPADQGAELLHTAREAFTASLHVTGDVAAVIFAGPAVLILTIYQATWTARPHFATTRRLTHRALLSRSSVTDDSQPDESEAGGGLSNLDQQVPGCRRPRLPWLGPVPWQDCNPPNYQLSYAPPHCRRDIVMAGAIT